jgi:hypothetical protein
MTDYERGYAAEAMSDELLLVSEEWQRRFAAAFYDELIVNSADNPWEDCSEETRDKWVRAVFRALKRLEAKT